MRDQHSRIFKGFFGTHLAETRARPGDLPDTEILAHAPEQTDLSAHIANRTLNTDSSDRPVTFLPSSAPVPLLPHAQH
jgi:hypothetical protein